MKYSVSKEIDRPLDEVVEKFDNSENLFKWMEGLQKYEHLSGEPGKPGAKTRLLFQMGNRKIEMIETITVRNLPDEFSATYEAKGVFNIVKNLFKPLDNNRTLCTNDQEFQFKGFMKVMGFLMPGAFKKQSLQYLKKFKEFVENTENS